MLDDPATRRLALVLLDWLALHETDAPPLMVERAAMLLDDCTGDPDGDLQDSQSQGADY